MARFDWRRLRTGLGGRRRKAVMLGALALWAISLGAWALYARTTTLVDSFAKCAEEGYPISESDPPVCRVGNHSFIGPRGTAASPDAGSNTTSAGISQPFDLLVDGDSHGAYPNRQEVFIADQGWQSYWRQVHSGLHSTPPLLPIDFTKNDVVAISEGVKPTGGYGLKVVSITSGPKGTVVDVTESVPTITCVVTQAASNRYVMVRTPKLPPPVSFRITTEHKRCN